MSTTIPFITIPQMQSNLGQVTVNDLVMLIQGTEHERAAAIKLKELCEEIGSMILWTASQNKLGDVQFVKETTSGGYYYIAYLNDRAVDSNHLKYGSVDWHILKDEAVSEAKIQNNAVTASKIANGAVTPEKINTSAVTTAKIASKAVTTAKLDSNAVTTEKLNSDVIGLILDSWTISHRWPSLGATMSYTNFPFPRALVSSKLRITTLTNKWSTTEELVKFTISMGTTEKIITNLTSGWSSHVNFVRYIDIDIDEASNLIGANYINVGAKEDAVGNQLDMNFTVQSIPSV